MRVGCLKAGSESTFRSAIETGKPGSESTFPIGDGFRLRSRLARASDLARANGATELRLYGATEAVGAVQVLALQARADGVGFLGCHVVHDEGTIAHAPLFCPDGERVIGGVRADQGIRLAECVMPMA